MRLISTTHRARSAGSSSIRAMRLCPGTSARTLAELSPSEAGGPSGPHVAEKTGSPVPSWVVVDESTWLRFADGPANVTLAVPVDVFNGTDLVTFPAGSVSVCSARSRGAARRHDTERAVRQAFGDGRGRRGVAAGRRPGRLPCELRFRPGRLGLRRWLQSLPSRAEPTTATPR